MRKLSLSKRARMTVISTALLALFIGTTAESCGSSSDQQSGQKQEDTSRQADYNSLIKTQPAESMSYSPTRATKNFWIETWNKKGKLSYVYMRNSSGQVYGYYIFDGLPVSYCTSLIPPYQVQTFDNGQGGSTALAVPGPSVDGTFASSSNCAEYYGKDAVNGAYVEYSVGMGTNVTISDQPLPQYGDAQPLADATIAKVAK